MNLVAKEIPVVSDDGCALVLSQEAGAYWELREDASSSIRTTSWRPPVPCTTGSP